jgi:hypothetical protein
MPLAGQRWSIFAAAWGDIKKLILALERVEITAYQRAAATRKSERRRPAGRTGFINDTKHILMQRLPGVKHAGGTPMTETTKLAYLSLTSLIHTQVSAEHRTPKAAIETRMIRTDAQASA